MSDETSQPMLGIKLSKSC